jgi:hypothetical protein
LSATKPVAPIKAIFMAFFLPLEPVPKSGE